MSQIPNALEDRMFSPRISVVFTVLSITATPNLYAAHCSNTSLNGTYAYSTQGFAEVTPDVSAAGFVPFAQTGLIVYDGRGHISSGTFTYSTTAANGGSFRGTFTGTYAVSDDCSGTITVTIEDGTVFHFDLVVQSPSAYTTINTDSGGFLSVYAARKLSSEN